MSHAVAPLLMFYQIADGLEYLRRGGAAPPAQAPARGRYPTANQVRTAVGHLEGCRTDFTVGPTKFDVQIDRDDGAWTFLCFIGYDGAGDSPPRQMYFQSGDPCLIPALLRLLAEECGPFVLLVNDEEPEIVTSPADA